MSKLLNLSNLAPCKRLCYQYYICETPIFSREGAIYPLSKYTEKLGIVA